MRHSPTRLVPAVVPAVVLALVSPAVVSCGLLDGGGHLDDALDLTPAGATDVRFVDRGAVLDRLGVDDVRTGASDDEIREVTGALEDEPAAGTDLLTDVYLMQGAAFSEVDVVWSVQGRSGGEPFTVYRLDDDVDLGDVREDLVDAGFDASGDDGRAELTLASPDDALDETNRIGGRYPASFLAGATIDADEHLVVTGTGRADVESALDDDTDSLTDAGTYDDVLDGLTGSDDVEFVALSDADGCDVLGERTTPEEVARAAAEVGDLGRPGATAVSVSGDDAQIAAAMQFADDAAAGSDAAAREDYLADGDLLTTQRAASDLFTADVEQDGDLVRVTIDDVADAPYALQSGVDRDGFTRCGPDA